MNFFTSCLEITYVPASKWNGETTFQPMIELASKVVKYESSHEMEWKLTGDQPSACG